MMLRMKRRVMRRLVNICLIDMTVPKVSLERPFRRFDSGDKIYQREPSERFSRGNNVPKGLFWRLDFSTLAFGTRVNPSGR
jgi:hypothetical protein